MWLREEENTAPRRNMQVHTSVTVDYTRNRWTLPMNELRRPGWMELDGRLYPQHRVYIFIDLIIHVVMYSFYLVFPGPFHPFPQDGWRLCALSFRLLEATRLEDICILKPRALVEGKKKKEGAGSYYDGCRDRARGGAGQAHSLSEAKWVEDLHSLKQQCDNAGNLQHISKMPSSTFFGMYHSGVGVTAFNHGHGRGGKTFSRRSQICIPYLLVVCSCPVFRLLYKHIFS